MSFNANLRNKKCAIRRWAVHNNEGKRPAKYAIFLPAEQHLCCIEAMKSGIINQKTKMLIIERDANIMSSIKKNYTSLCKDGLLPTDVKFYNSELYKLDLSIFPHKIDFAFLDIYGELNSNNFEFISRSLTSTLSQNSDIAFTFCINNRNNKFIYEMHKLCQENECIQKEISRVWPNYCFDDYKATSIMCALLFALHKFDINQQEQPIRYRDTSYKMICIRLNNLEYSEGTLFPAELMNKVQILVDKYAKKESFCQKSSIKQNTVCGNVKPHATLSFLLTRRNTMPMITGAEVVTKITEATTAGKKAAATRLKKQFLQQQENAGKDPKWVEAGLKALITRWKNKG